MSRHDEDGQSSSGQSDEAVDHPAHYGGAGNPYEHRLVARAWGLSYALGSATKYICRAGKKGGADPVTDLRKARFWIEDEIARLEEERRQRATAAEGSGVGFPRLPVI